MGTFLAADDMNVGDWVTIHSRVRRKRTRQALLEQCESAWPIRRGVPIQIAALNFPFVMCEGYEQGKSSRRPVVVEIDRFRLCRVSRDYAIEFNRLKDLQAPAPTDESTDE